MSFPVENIRALCKKRGTSLAALERSLGFGNGVIAGWETAKSYPPYDRVSAVAAATESEAVTPAAKRSENEEQHDPPRAIAAPAEAVTVAGVGRSHRHSHHGGAIGKRHSITPFEKIFISNRGHDFDYLKSP